MLSGVFLFWFAYHQIAEFRISGVLNPLLLVNRDQLQLLYSLGRTPRKEIARLHKGRRTDPLGEPYPVSAARSTWTAEPLEAFLECL